MTTGRKLTNGQLQELEAELQNERARLGRSIMSEPDANSWMASDGAAVGNLAATQEALGIGLQTRTHARYDSINAALARLANGSYGICAGCHQPIPYGRLTVMPEATHCVTCRFRA